MKFLTKNKGVLIFYLIVFISSILYINICQTDFLSEENTNSYVYGYDVSK